MIDAIHLSQRSLIHPATLLSEQKMEDYADSITSYWYPSDGEKSTGINMNYAPSERLAKSFQDTLRQRLVLSVHEILI